LAALAVVISPACGGPEVIDPDPTQSVAYYFSGIEEGGHLHVHVHWVQNKRNLTLLSPCIPQDDCDIYGLSATGNAALGLTQPPFVVDLASGSGTFSDPGISWTITTKTGKTFTYTGTVATSGDQVQMVGTLTGANGTFGPSHLVMDRQR
jgi:hypothetical protein